MAKRREVKLWGDSISLYKPLTPPKHDRQDQADSGFLWPVRGRLIQNFGERKKSGKSDGIRIAAKEGTAIKATEDGTVIYSGNEFASYGNLVIIKHDGNLHTSYAHQKHMLVKKGQPVKKGQIIGYVGSTGGGGVREPHLYFSIHNNKNPVNPVNYLNKGNPEASL
jgi:murein DD-endopeptidase MepM/ murein hydrolase activator NlpD